MKTLRIWYNRYKTASQNYDPRARKIITLPPSGDQLYVKTRKEDSLKASTGLALTVPPHSTPRMKAGLSCPARGLHVQRCSIILRDLLQVDCSARHESCWNYEPSKINDMVLAHRQYYYFRTQSATGCKSRFNKGSKIWATVSTGMCHVTTSIRGVYLISQAEGVSPWQVGRLHEKLGLKQG